MYPQMRFARPVVISSPRGGDAESPQTEFGPEWMARVFASPYPLGYNSTHGSGERQGTLS